MNGVAIDAAAVAWTMLVAVVAAALFGLVPALKMAGDNVQEALKDSGPAAGRGRRHERLRIGLVISEIALACVLLVGAGLLLRSFLNVLDVNLGFAPDRAATIAVDYNDDGPSPEMRAARRSATFQQILARVRALPGVEMAGMSDYLPLGPNRSWGTPAPKGKVYRPGEVPPPLVYVVTPGFLPAMGIRLRGRDFTWEDRFNGQLVVVINASAARFYWPGEDAVGKLLTNGFEELQVIAVADDVREENVEGSGAGRSTTPRSRKTPPAHTWSSARVCRSIRSDRASSRPCAS